MRMVAGAVVLLAGAVLFGAGAVAEAILAAAREYAPRGTLGMIGGTVVGLVGLVILISGFQSDSPPR